MCCSLLRQEACPLKRVHSVLQFIVAYCSVSQCATVCCSVLQCDAGRYRVLQGFEVCCSMLQYLQW